MQRPIAFASNGEKLADFDVFYPDRLAGRILGMGDVLTLIEKAEEAYDKAEAEDAATKLMEGRFTLEDFLAQMQQLKKMGPLQGILGMLPGIPKEVRSAQIDDKQVGHIEAIIRSMTPAERDEPSIIDGSRRSRIAKGSGTSPGEVSALITQFVQVQSMMKRFGGFGSKRLGGKKKNDKKKGTKGGRTTLRGPAPVPQVDLAKLAEEPKRSGLRLPGL